MPEMERPDAPDCGDAAGCGFLGGPPPFRAYRSAERFVRV